MGIELKYARTTDFLVSSVRADGRLEIDQLTLPPAVEEQRKAGKQVHASYLFEITVSIRGKAWQLHRRIGDENSAIMRQFDELFPTRDQMTKEWQPDRTASPFLFTVFLDMDQSQTKDTDEPTVAFAADLCVRATEYEVDGLLFFKDHFEGGYLFREMITFEAAPPRAVDNKWAIQYRFESQRENGWQRAQAKNDTDLLTFVIPIEQRTPPGIRARLHVETRFWNDWQSTSS